MYPINPAGDGTGNFRVDAGSFYGSYADALEHVQRLLARDRNLAEVSLGTSNHVYTGPVGLHELQADDMKFIFALTPFWPSVWQDCIADTWSNIKQAINNPNTQDLIVDSVRFNYQSYNSSVATKVREVFRTIPKDHYVEGWQP